jgi:hypothetical protein
LTTKDLIIYGMFFTALSYAAMSRAFPLAGSVYTYARHGLNEIAGFFSGWLILLDYTLVPALLYVLSAVALRAIFPAVPYWVWLAVFISFNAAVNGRRDVDRGAELPGLRRHFDTFRREPRNPRCRRQGDHSVADSGRSIVHVA